MSSSLLSSLPEQTAALMAAVAALSDLDELREAEAAITGKRSVFASMQRSLGTLEPDERKSAGAQVQEARRLVVEAFEAAPARTGERSPTPRARSRSSRSRRCRGKRRCLGAEGRTPGTRRDHPA